MQNRSLNFFSVELCSSYLNFALLVVELRFEFDVVSRFEKCGCNKCWYQQTNNYENNHSEKIHLKTPKDNTERKKYYKPRYHQWINNPSCSHDSNISHVVVKGRKSIQAYGCHCAKVERRKITQQRIVYHFVSNVNWLSHKSNNKVWSSQTAKQSRERWAKSRSPENGSNHQRVTSNGHEHQCGVKDNNYDDQDVSGSWPISLGFVLKDGVVVHSASWKPSLSEDNRGSLVEYPEPLAFSSYGGVQLFALSVTLKHLVPSDYHDHSHNLSRGGLIDLYL